MIVDSSALIAVILNEEDEERYLRTLVSAPVLRMSAATWVETWIVIDSKKNLHAEARFDDLTATLKIEIVPVTAEIAYRARRAYRDFGRGNHRAKLNFGNCFSYALAKVQGEALLFKGNDFGQTDVEVALKP